MTDRARERGIPDWRYLSLRAAFWRPLHPNESVYEKVKLLPGASTGDSTLSLDS